MTSLARKLSLWNYFALGFGTMIGTGWVILMDDWLGRGGPLGAMIGFLMGGILLLPIGYVYGQWVRRLPDRRAKRHIRAGVSTVCELPDGLDDAAGVFHRVPVGSSGAGEAGVVHFPAARYVELYRVAGQPFSCHRLLVGMGLTLFLSYLNYRGIRASAVFQNWATSSVLVVFFLLVLISAHGGSPANFKPAFSHTPLVSIL